LQRIRGSEALTVAGKDGLGCRYEDHQFAKKDCLAHGFKVIWLLALLLCVVRKTKLPFWRPTSFLFGGQKLHLAVKVAIFGCKISRLCLAQNLCGAQRWVMVSECR
jgi:hypothetical protein